ncbi:MAG TPA: hypothetical protein VKF60_17235 [Myxococcota bacterium]|nr:hypothetical protein [Myxococcota bacterium]
MARSVRFAFIALCLGLCACPAARRARVPDGAVLLYDVAFSAPEQALNEEVKVVEPQTVQPFPSKIPSTIFFGHPTVIAKLCGLEQQPVQLAVASATEGLEGLEFLLDQRYGRYHVELDLCVQQIDPPPLPAQALQVAVFLDVADAYALGFMTGGVLAIVDPNLHPETLTTPQPVGKFELRKPMHLSFDVDLEKQNWRIAVDGNTVYDAPLEATIPRAVRVMVRGNPTTAVAFDNFLIWGEHDLTPAGTTLTPPIAGPELPPPEAGPQK